MNGVLIIDKPGGLTSHDVVNRVRRILQQRSVGHLGTLDPLATGVLPLVVGNLTRLAQFYTQSEKVYDARVRFGFSTDTYDAEGTATSERREIVLDGHPGHAVLEGTIGQMPARVHRVQSVVVEATLEVAGTPSWIISRPIRSTASSLSS